MDEEKGLRLWWGGWWSLENKEEAGQLAGDTDKGTARGIRTKIKYKK